MRDYKINRESKIEEAQIYRDNLAEKIKEEPNKEIREKILSIEKMGINYREAHDEHLTLNFLEKNREIIKKICLEANTYDELLNSISNEKSIMLINNDLGWDHLDNVIKRIKMAKALNNADLVPVDGGLKEKVASLLFSENQNNPSSEANGSYTKYIEENFKDLNLDEKDLQKISSKIPPEVFTSIDQKMERPVLLLNSLDNVKTKFSCSGHFDKEYKESPDPGEGLNLYLNLETENKDLINKLQSLNNIDNCNVIILANKNNKAGNLSIRFSLDTPPLDWIEENEKMTKKEIIKKSKSLLGEYFQTKIYLNDFYGLTMEAESLQNEKLSKNPGMASKPMAKSSLLLEEVEKLCPPYIKRKEYKEYFDENMIEIIKRRDDFIDKIEQVLKEYKEENKNMPSEVELNTA